MSSDFLIYAGIVLVIAIYVIGFTAWKSANPASRKPEQTLFLLCALGCGGGAIWISVITYLAWRETGIYIMRGDEWKLAKIVLLSVGAALAFRASRSKRKKEPNQSLQPTAPSGRG